MITYVYSQIIGNNLYRLYHHVWLHVPKKSRWPDPLLISSQILLAQLNSRGTDWFTFNTFKTKFVMFHQCRADTKFSWWTIVLSTGFLLVTSPNPNWNTYNTPSLRMLEKLSVPCNCSRKYHTLGMLCLYTSQIRPKMKYCCHTLA